MKSTTPEDIGQMAEDMVVWMSMATSNGKGFHEVPAAYFSGAFPMSQDWLRALGKEKDEIYCNDEFGALRRPLDISFINRQRLDPGIVGVERSEWTLNRVRLVNPASCRKMLRTVKRYGGPLVEIAVASIHADNTLYSTRTFLEKRGSTWETCRQQGRRYTDSMSLQDFLDEEDRSVGLVHIGAGVQLNNEYKWIVALGWDGYPSVSFDTDPVGAREVFRLRDLPEGASRRAALLHWVREHWRKNRSDSTEEHKVREHLRGATKFVWNGLKCEITPGEYDLERAGREMPRAKEVAEDNAGMI